MRGQGWHHDKSYAKVIVKVARKILTNCWDVLTCIIANVCWLLVWNVSWWQNTLLFGDDQNTYLLLLQISVGFCLTMCVGFHKILRHALQTSTANNSICWQLYVYWLISLFLIPHHVERSPLQIVQLSWDQTYLVTVTDTHVDLHVVRFKICSPLCMLPTSSAPSFWLSGMFISMF